MFTTFFCDTYIYSIIDFKDSLIEWENNSNNNNNNIYSQLNELNKICGSKIYLWKFLTKK